MAYHRRGKISSELFSSRRNTFCELSNVSRIIPIPRVILESPYAGEIERNRIFAICCIRDMLDRGEAPYASHVLYPPASQKFTKKERDRGMKAGYAWMAVADLVAVYTNLGQTEGMLRGITRAKLLKLRIEWRQLKGAQWQE